MEGIKKIKEDRFKKLDIIKKAGINPYPAKSEPEYYCRDVFDDFTKFSKKRKLTIAGRVRGMREHGGSIFIDIDDGTLKMQVYFRKDIIGEKKYDMLKSAIDLGDFMEVSGSLFKTKKGEKTILAKSYGILAKSLAPLPEKWHGLQDPELKFRKRYLDLIMNQETKELFIKKTKFIDSFKNYLKKNDFLEVETPILENIPGGADAEPFITHHNTLDMDLYLRISLELHLKRLIIGGFNKVFEVGKVFRNEGMSREHLQEFTLLEFYRAYWNYEQLMDFIEKMYKKIIKESFGKLKFEYGGTKIDFGEKWKKVKYYDVFKKYSGIDLKKIKTKEDMIKEIESKNIDIEIEKDAGFGRIMDQVYKKTVRPNLIGPLFLIDHPVIISPLAKNKNDDPDIAERFQVLIVGSEVGNGFSELNDPVEQKKRFEEQAKLRAAGDKEAQMMDEDFIEALEYGMPPTAGFGVGIERLFMILSGVGSIRETVLFPMMRNII